MKRAETKRKKFMCPKCKKINNEINMMISTVINCETRLHDSIPDFKRQYYLGPKCTLDVMLNDLTKVRDKLIELDINERGEK